MFIRYLGTAAAEGTPGIFCGCRVCRESMKSGGKDIRTRSQAIIDDALLVDFPPDSYWHMVQHGVDLPNIAHLLITHTHQDHVYPDEFFYRLKGFCVTEGLLTIYGNDAVKRRMDDYLNGIAHSYEDAKMACVQLEPYAAASIGAYSVTPLLAAHDKGERCYIYIIEGGGKRLLYGNDTGVFPAHTWAHIKDKPFDLISLDCTCGQTKEGSNHMGVPDLLEMKQRLKENGNMMDSTVLVATHFSHNGGLLHSELEERLAPAGYLVAHDGLRVDF